MVLRGIVLGKRDQFFMVPFIDRSGNVIESVGKVQHRPAWQELGLVAGSEEVLRGVLRGEGSGSYPDLTRGSVVHSCACPLGHFQSLV